MASREAIRWAYHSTYDCAQMANQVSAALINLGLSTGDKIAISDQIGRPFWYFLEMGALQIGLIVVPISSRLKKSELSYILQHAEVRFCFVGDRELWTLFNEISQEVPLLQKVMTFHQLPDIESVESKLVAPSSKHLEVIQTHKAAIHEDDTALILYGASIRGNLQGVMLSHKNLVSTIKILLPQLNISPGKKVLSFNSPCLFSEHLFLFTYLAAGSSIYFSGSQDRLLAQIQEIKPTFLGLSPAQFEALIEQVLQPDRKRHQWYRNLKVWGIKTGKKFAGRSKISLLYWLRLLLVDLLVFRFWRRKLGGKLEAILVGGEPVREDLNRLVSAWGIHVIDGFGVPETTGIIALKDPANPKHYFDTYGKILDTLETRKEEASSPDLEVKGNSLMQGYFKDEAATNAIFTKDGWLRTGLPFGLIDERWLSNE